MNPITRKISKFTKFGCVSLFSNQAVTCQRLPKFHTNVSNSEMASPKSVHSSIFPIFESLLHGCNLRQNLKFGKLTSFNVIFVM